MKVQVLSGAPTVKVFEPYKLEKPAKKEDEGEAAEVASLCVPTSILKLIK